MFKPNYKIISWISIFGIVAAVFLFLISQKNNVSYNQTKEISNLIKQVNETRTKLPRAINKYTILNDLFIDDDELVYDFAINDSGIEFLESTSFDAGIICKDITIEQLNKNGYAIRANYSHDKKHIKTVVVNANECEEYLRVSRVVSQINFFDLINDKLTDEQRTAIKRFEAIKTGKEVEVEDSNKYRKIIQEMEAEGRL